MQNISLKKKYNNNNNNNHQYNALIDDLMVLPVCIINIIKVNNCYNYFVLKKKNDNVCLQVVTIQCKNVNIFNEIYIYIMYSYIQY